MQGREHTARLKKTKRLAIRLDNPGQGLTDQNTATQNTGTITDDTDSETKVPTEVDDLTQPPGTETDVLQPVVQVKPKRLAVKIDAPPFAVKSVADEAFVTSEYATFYDPITGARAVDHQTKQGQLYTSMSTFDGPYLKEPTNSWNLAPYMIRSLEGGPYSLVSQNGADFDKALADGDYFHFINRAPTSPPYNGVARRIVVNAWSQQNSLKLAAALEPLFSDPSVRDSLLSFKVLLSSNSLDETPKGDKIVIYYNPDAGSPDDDRVGNRIVRTVTDTLADSERDARIAPFYSGVGKGIAWSEEKGGASFTTVREMLMRQVVNENPQIGSEKEFFDLVSAKFKSAGVDPANTHQYETTNTAPPMPGPRLT